MKKIRAAIEGGAGYTAGELIRILINHPNVELSFINSNSHHGRAVSDVHRDLLEDTQLLFGQIDYNAIDVLFLCQGHEKSKIFLKEKDLPQRLKIIDLSTDFRDGTDGFIYGLPELNRKSIINCSRLANPGCFATSVQLALLPLAANGLLTDDVHISSITGSTGSGQALSDTNHFSWRENNVSTYKPLQHQHLDEINRNILKLQSGFRGNINLVTLRGNFTRGIYSSLYTKSKQSKEDLQTYFRQYYSGHPFIRLTEELPDLKLVVNTNKCVLYLDKIGDKIFLVSTIDNLLKGASGQAVQNMNLMFGLNETEGLKIKGTGF